MVLIVSSEADTAVIYIAAVTNRLETREELDAFFCLFETIVLLIKKHSFKLTKCSVCKTIFNL